LPHQPDRRHDLLLTSENVHQRFGHRFTRGSLIFNTNRILESVVVAWTVDWTHKSACTVQA
jgi:hypothetical protein